MRAHVMVIAAFAAFLVSCIDYTGLGADGSAYTKPSACVPAGATTCTAASCDDGTAAASSLTSRSRDCSYRNTERTWETAVSDCAGLGYRLPTKGEALKIASNPSICRTSLPSVWATWTSACAGAGLAWYVSSFGGGNTGQDGVDYVRYGEVLCVR